MEIDRNNLHHAYLILGSKTDGEVYLASVLENLGLKEAGNPDFLSYRLESFDIESAREVKDKAREKPFGEKKIILISAERFTHQAQNALLKTFEEPSANTHFFILLGAPDLLLPTLLSRMQIVHIRQNYSREKFGLPRAGDPRTLGEDNSASVSKFLKSSLKDRINFAKKFADNEKSLPAFLDSMLSMNSNAEQQKKIFTVRRFADDPSKMTRLILEHLALVLE
jgi:hypothetical protein